jgi:Calcineurin-like phosphoesterase
MALGGARTGWSQSAQSQWDAADRVIVFGDVHGAANELRELLRETGVVDTDGHWVAGTAHLVSLGDLLDRGADARQVLDLLMQLQAEARAAGGQVHVLLGNHEAMNLMGDLRYVHPREYAAYSDLESAAERERARADWEKEPRTAPCPAFDVKYPVGYFGRKAAFAPTGVYGRWLLAQPVAIRIGDSLFMHGGPSGLLRDMTLPELNLRYRTALTDVLTRPAAESQLPLLSDSGPNWYRGTALCHEASEADVLLPLLQQFQVARVVIGHTPTRNSRVVSRFDGRVIRLDTGMNRAAYRGRPAALLIDPSGIRVRYTAPSESAAVEPEGLFVAPDALSDSDVTAALRDGTVKIVRSRGPGEFDVTVTLQGRAIPAVFQVRAAAAIRNELAALKVDRLLGIGIVPATVEREIEGRRGLLQARPRNWLTQAQVREQSLRAGGSCDAEAQFQLLYALDTLLGNEARTAESLVWDTDSWMVFGTSFSQAFGTSRGLPGFLRERPPVIGAALRRTMAKLDEKQLAASLGSSVSPRAQRSILARRDTLLALPSAASRP